MTDEELKYYSHPKMQAFFREKMGRWQEGDPFYCMECKMTGFTQYFRDTDPFTDRTKSYLIQHYGHSDKAIRLPLPIDLVNPERGLWGMVYWEQFALRKYPGKPVIFIHIISGRRIAEKLPYLALLKALAAQLEVVI